MKNYKMFRMRKFGLTVMLLTAISFAGLQAQNSEVLYFMNLPQNHLLNPALRPSNSVYIGLPAITGINININNNFVNFSDVIMKGERGDSLITFLHPEYNEDKFLAKIKKKNSIEPEAMVQLFGLGFSFGRNNYFFIDVNDRIQGNAVIPGDLFTLALKGNGGFAGDRIDLSSLRGSIRYYREAGVGFSKDFSDRLRIGVKGKVLFGIATATLKNRSLGISVGNDYSHTLDADLDINFSAPLTIERDNEKNISGLSFNEPDNKVGFLMGTKNKGLGFDIGASYKIQERLYVSAAITDLGFIRWKKDVLNLRSENQFTFSGFNVNDVLSGDKTMDDVANDMLDSLKNAFKITDSKDPFTTFIPWGFTVSGSYNLTRRFSVGLLSYSRFIGKQVREALTLSANLNLGNALSTTVSYTAANHRYDNIGAGLAFRAGFCQFYLLTDRIPLSWNRINNGDSSFVIPTSWNNVNLRLGMNFVFGNRIKKKNDKAMVECETIPVSK
jgi:hypothetical protein